MDKHCRTCDRTLPAEMFHRMSSAPDGRQYKCKDCTAAWGRSRPKRPPASREQYSTYWRRHLARTYGMTPEQYDELLIGQAGRCAICRAPVTANRRLLVDHCHRTAKIRGLLCGPCNTGIGQLRDDTETVRQAYLYLKEYDDADSGNDWEEHR